MRSAIVGTIGLCFSVVVAAVAGPPASGSDDSSRLKGRDSEVPKVRGSEVLTSPSGDAGSESVVLRADDGFRLFADFVPPSHAQGSPAPVAVLLHAFRGDRSSWMPLVSALRQAGFAVLALDLRGHGESATTESAERVDSRDPELVLEMQQDLRAAYAWLAKRKEADLARVAIVGSGTGCGLALQYAAMDRSVDAVVCLSPELDDLGLKPEQDIKQIQGRRILLMGSMTEQAACDALEKMTDSATKQLMSGSEHGVGLLTGNSGAIRDVVEFVRVSVGPPSTKVVYGSINSNIYHAGGSGWIAEIGANNLRLYSSPAEAEERGLRPSRSKGPEDRQRNRGRR